MIQQFLEFLLTLTSPDLVRIFVDTCILVLTILCFCSALYLVTEIRIPDSTIEQCRKLNEIAHLEWIFNLSLGIAFIFCRYFVCGFLTFPVGVYHFVRFFQHGNDVFDPISIHRKNSRERQAQYYGAKLVFYTIIFLTVMVYLGFGILDYVMKFDWGAVYGVPFAQGPLSISIK